MAGLFTHDQMGRGLRIATHKRRPQVVWSLFDGNYDLLQTLPITPDIYIVTERHARVRNILSRSNGWPTQSDSGFTKLPNGMTILFIPSPDALVADGAKLTKQVLAHCPHNAHHIIFGSIPPATQGTLLTGEGPKGPRIWPLRYYSQIGSKSGGPDLSFRGARDPPPVFPQ